MQTLHITLGIIISLGSLQNDSRHFKLFLFSGRLTAGIVFICVHKTADGLVQVWQGVWKRQTPAGDLIVLSLCADIPHTLTRTQIHIHTHKYSRHTHDNTIIK